MQGIVGVFRELDATVDAVHALKKLRAGNIDIYTPAPRHELEHILTHRASIVRLYTLLGGLAGATFGYWIPIWISDYWPLVVGGKPVPSWVPYTIISFELMVLIGSLATVAGLFITARIPRITMTVGYDERFSNANFGVWVECPPDKQADVTETLKQHGATEVRGER
ncbi:MAG TPA: DUF3341 domain-containing protein [Gemmatimonadaceae bacterium]|jgi:molybdopterin-containing oxidoreductase family membrane subunit|nr:DUF3341 domain-containing protein [Gemmatimonadaceae bacterium]